MARRVTQRSAARLEQATANPRAAGRTLDARRPAE